MGMRRTAPGRLRRAAAAAAGLLLAAAAHGQQAAGVVAVPSWRQASSVGIVTVRGEIDAMTRASVERRVTEAAADGCGAAVLELDTPGGDMYATLELCLWIKDRSPIPVWAWVRPRAYSAGAIIALACKGILVSPGAAFGDAAPIAALPGLGLQPLPLAERAKLEAPILAEVVDSARRRRYDEALVRAFVSAPDEVWMLERDDGTARIFVSRQEYRDAFGADPPVSRAAGGPRDGLSEGAVATPWVDLSMRRRPDEGPRNDAERDALVEDQQVLPPSRERLVPADAARWRVVGQVDGAEELLVVYGPEAIAFGLADRAVADDRGVAGWFGATALRRYDEHFGDALVRFLTSWPVRLLLVAVVLGGFLLEFAVPGLGWFGLAAAIALALLLGAPLLAGITAWWPIVVVLLGGALVLVEVFLVPGVGVVGFLGGACVLVGLVASFLEAPLGTPEGRDDLTAAIAVVAGGGIVAAGAAWGLLRVLPRSRLLGAAVLDATVGGAGGAPNAVPAAPPSAGMRGNAATPLRPVGKASFGGRMVEVQAIGGWIDAGAPIVVVRSTPYAVEVEEERP